MHAPGEVFYYPTSRARIDPDRLAQRYLECVLVQAASLLLRGDAPCDVALVTNLTDRRSLGVRGQRLLAEIEAMGVEVLLAEYLHRPLVETPAFASSRYLFDAILAAASQRREDRQLWLVDVDCVWLDPRKTLAAAPPVPGIGCIHIPYPPDWMLLCGSTPRQMGELAQRLGAREPSGVRGDLRSPGDEVRSPGDDLRWVGGELLAGTADDLLALVSACERLEREVHELGEAEVLTTEEQLLSLAGALGRVQLHDLSAVARRIWTGPRHGAAPVEHPESLGLWHLPSEKGLGFRRAANTITAGRSERLTRDLETPARALRRFNVAGAGWTRRIRDDGWLAAQRLLERRSVPSSA